MFQLHPRLEADTVPVSRLELCHLRLMDNRIWPWLILVPARPDVVELHQLSEGDRHVLIDEIARTSKIMQDLFAAHKINVGALGNVVPQLHVHVIVRHPNDPAWPGPVWGSGHAEPYAPEERDTLVLRLRAALA